MPDAREIAIQRIVDAYQDASVADSGLSAENIQARVRGNILMSVSNDEGALVLACGNKSEYSVGYATLYGDTCGGFAPLRDVGKLKVYELARFINDRAGSELIPESVIERPPSAELAPDQQDTDSLPAYEVLDPQLRRIVETDEDGVNEQVERLVWRSEYKRRQAPPGPRVTAKAFGRDRRMPIANGWASSRLRPRSS
jgi:NAD+ synthase (glutamine-hydrolysing)